MGYYPKKTEFLSAFLNENIFLKRILLYADHETYNYSSIISGISLYIAWEYMYTYLYVFTSYFPQFYKKPGYPQGSPPGTSL